MNQKIMPIFDQTHPNDNILHQLIHKIQPISESRDLMGHTHFLITPTQKNFQATFSFHELVSTCKKSGIFSICSRDIVHLKILQSDWLAAF